MISTTNDCINNLRQIGDAFQMFALDHSDRFPWQCPVTNNGTLELIGSESPAPHFQTVSNYVRSYGVLVCPADGARQAVTNFTSISNRNISYFVSTDAKPDRPNLILAGDRNLEIAGRPVKPGSFVLTTNASLGWSSGLHSKHSRERRGNILFTDERHTETPPMTNLAAILVRQGLATNRLVFP
jgi:hypothetical protein